MPENTKYEIGKVGLRAGFFRTEMFLMPKFSENIWVFTFSSGMDFLHGE